MIEASFVPARGVCHRPCLCGFRATSAPVIPATEVDTRAGWNCLSGARCARWRGSAAPAEARRLEASDAGPRQDRRIDDAARTRRASHRARGCPPWTGPLALFPDRRLPGMRGLHPETTLGLGRDLD